MAVLTSMHFIPFNKINIHICQHKLKPKRAEILCAVGNTWWAIIHRFLTLASCPRPDAQPHVTQGHWDKVKVKEHPGTLIQQPTGSAWLTIVICSSLNCILRLVVLGPCTFKVISGRIATCGRATLMVTS